MWNALSWTLEQDVQMEGEIHCLEVEAGFLMCGYEGPTPMIPGVTVGMVAERRDKGPRRVHV